MKEFNFWDDIAKREQISVHAGAPWWCTGDRQPLPLGGGAGLKLPWLPIYVPLSGPGPRMRSCAGGLLTTAQTAVPRCASCDSYSHTIAPLHLFFVQLVCIVFNALSCPTAHTSAAIRRLDRQTVRDARIPLLI